MKILIFGLLFTLQVFAVPDKNWVMKQVWNNLAFTHFEVDPVELKRILPPKLKLDTYLGRAYVGIVTLEMTTGRLNHVPIPLYRPFPQVNVRTYVNCNGKRGVYFFRLDADHALGPLMAKLAFDIPYFKSDLQWEKGRNQYYMNSQAEGRNFEISYKPINGTYPNAASSLETWLTEVYRSYQVSKNGKISETRLWHRPFKLQRVDAKLWNGEAFEALKLKALDKPSFHYVDHAETYFWNNKPVDCH